MPMRAALKQCAWERLGDDLVVVFDPREAITLADPDGHVQALLEELRRGPRTAAGIRSALAAEGRQVSQTEVEAAVAGLDSLGLLEDGDARWLGDPEVDARHATNLAFFTGYSTLDRSRASFVRALRGAHVLVLGVGGVGSSMLMCLAGLGVGRLTLVDRDDLEPSNLAKQFVYRSADIGRSKVDRAAEWVREHDPEIEVRPVDHWISRPEDLVEVMDGVDLVVGAIDGPRESQLWVNDAAVRAGVPLVGGGLNRSQLVYYSVHPGRSSCRRCDSKGWPSLREPTAASIGRRLSFGLQEGANALIGPLTMHIGSLMVYEALRYLTGFEPPRAAGAYVLLDLRTGLQPRWEPFTEDPDCPVCAVARPDLRRVAAR